MILIIINHPYADCLIIQAKYDHCLSLNFLP